MEKIMKNFFRSSIFTSITLIILGLLLIFQSEATIISISYIIGGILVAFGGLGVIRFVQGAKSENGSGLDLVYGVVTVIFGALIITHPKAIASFIPVFIGIGIIISSVTKLQYAFELKSNKNRLWKATMVVSIISTLCGIILLFNPFKGAQLLTTIIGIFILIYALLDIISTITIKRNVNALHDALENAIVEAEVIEEKETKKKK